MALRKVRKVAADVITPSLTVICGACKVEWEVIYPTDVMAKKGQQQGEETPTAPSLWVVCPDCTRRLNIPENRYPDVLRFEKQLKWMT